MMFENKAGGADISRIADFIEKPGQDCGDDELEEGISSILTVLDKNPRSILDIIACHPYIPASFLLSDLAEKMQKKNCADRLSVLFSGYLSEITEACVYNIFDLKRLFEAAPAEYADSIILSFSGNERIFRRTITADENPEETLAALINQYPLYGEKFSDVFDRYFSDNLSNHM